MGSARDALQHWEETAKFRATSGGSGNSTKSGNIKNNNSNNGGWMGSLRGPSRPNNSNNNNNHDRNRNNALVAATAKPKETSLQRLLRQPPPNNHAAVNKPTNHFSNTIADDCSAVMDIVKNVGRISAASEKTMAKCSKYFTKMPAAAEAVRAKRKNPYAAAGGVLGQGGRRRSLEEVQKGVSFRVQPPTSSVGDVVGRSGRGIGDSIKQKLITKMTIKMMRRQRITPTAFHHRRRPHHLFYPLWRESSTIRNVVGV